MASFGGDFPEKELYEDAIKRHVCAHCIDFGEDKVCHSVDPEGCAVFRYLPELVSIAGQLNELKVEPYLQTVRDHVCMNCKNQIAGKCSLRDAVDCGLDRYLPLVIDAVEEVQARVI